MNKKKSRSASMERTMAGCPSRRSPGVLPHLGALGGGVPPGQHLDNGNSGGGRVPYLRFTVMRMK